MDTVKICFVRHGETDQNKLRRVQGRRNFPLNDTGRNQAKGAGTYLLNHNYQFDLIYSSPLDRAYETACIIKDIIGYNGEVIKKFNFTERDFGSAEGMPVTRENFEIVLNETCPGLEKSIDLSNRVVSGILEIIKENPNAKSILIVAHSHTIKGFYKYLYPDYSYYSAMCNCSINNFEYKDGSFTLIDKNINPLI